jgi:lactoylglutathione lyase
MASSLNSIGAVTLFVDDPIHSKLWYQRVFEAPSIHEDDVSAVVEMDNTIINLLQRTEAPELISPATVAVANSGSSFQFTIWVDDVDQAFDTLLGRGVEFLNGPIDRDWGQRTACFADPDGHIWEIAQSLA